MLALLAGRVLGLLGGILEVNMVRGNPIEPHSGEKWKKIHYRSLKKGVTHATKMKQKEGWKKLAILGH